jgi:hypothetical protein
MGKYKKIITLLATKYIPKFVLALFVRETVKRQEKIKLYYFKHPKNNPNHLNGKLNFGDYLSHFIVEGVTKKNVVHAQMEEIDLIAIGSIMNFLDSTSHKVKVWGTGHMYDKDLPVTNKNIEILALRGHFSLAKYPDLKDIPLGDPALLTSRYIKPSKDKLNKVGIIPHYVDKEDPRMHVLKNDPRFMIIDVFDSPIKVAKDISSCKYVISSSLHGVIVAHSYLVPAAWVELSNKVLGDGFKFKDYYSVFDVQPNKVTIEDIINSPFDENHYFSPEKADLLFICRELEKALIQG